ncbi:NAD(P)-binding domain-containing protein [Hyphococcus flavus]|uniref:NAD(P)-binding domain-containing protein n=1 Tax=Hyphococcus flavus TaxID=1866326 RepID=A0AAE9ZCM5_9PROT|nr:NAD(P)-binding domain-containing protein [Hyphococcus flavus]WDI30123.1 NAD(P)-binding domain-containing protein [Hyphococcus flavus]
MKPPLFITESDVLGKMRWRDVVESMRQGHQLARAVTRDVVIGEPDRSFLNRVAWIESLGGGMKSVTVFTENANKCLPAVQGAFLLFDDETGSLKAVIDSGLITKWKTAADSALGAQLLARKNSSKAVVIGAGALASALADAYAHMMPQLAKIVIWARKAEQAQKLADSIEDQRVVAAKRALEDCVRSADIIITATSSPTAVINGDWISPGAHVDLVGAFRSDMRESDDELMRKAKIFVDSRDTTIDHIGDLTLPIANGAIQRTDVLGDFYDLINGAEGRSSEKDITVFKNGGGAHLDLMTATMIYDAARK